MADGGQCVFERPCRRKLSCSRAQKAEAWRDVDKDDPPPPRRAFQKSQKLCDRQREASQSDQAQHDERLRALAASYGNRGVAFIAVDSEATATVVRDASEATRRGYSFPILVDREGRAARAMRADYATYPLLLDRTGRVLYRGGIDSDRSHLRDDATPSLRNAIDDAVAQRPVRLPEAKTLGCSLVLE